MKAHRAVHGSEAYLFGESNERSAAGLYIDIGQTGCGESDYVNRIGAPVFARLYGGYGIKGIGNQLADNRQICIFANSRSDSPALFGILTDLLTTVFVFPCCIWCIGIQIRTTEVQLQTIDAGFLKGCGQLDPFIQSPAGCAEIGEYRDSHLIFDFPGKLQSFYDCHSFIHRCDEHPPGNRICSQFSLEWFAEKGEFK